MQIPLRSSQTDQETHRKKHQETNQTQKNKERQRQNTHTHKNKTDIVSSQVGGVEIGTEAVQTRRNKNITNIFRARWVGGSRP